MRTPMRVASRRRFGHRSRDVVELEIEEDFAALLANHAHDRRPGVEEELLADLEEAHFAHQ